jgi:hypothetical protein
MSNNNIQGGKYNKLKKKTKKIKTNRRKTNRRKTNKKYNLPRRTKTTA